MINQRFREEFPFFSSDQRWTYLDSAATTLKPAVLLKATSDFYCSAGSVHRSQYDLVQTQAYEAARDLVAQRFNAVSRDAVIWTSGTTYSINLVAHGLAHQVTEGDEIIISVAEHHANFIPWQQLAQHTKARLIVLPVNENYQIDPAVLLKHLNTRTKIVAFNLVSNITGTRQPVEKLIPLIRQHSGAKIMLDIAQAVCYEQIDVQQIDADFYAFSAHKMYGPTGVGVLIGNLQSLSQLRPLVFGGKMVKEISAEQLVMTELPYRLEAGTPNIAGIIGFGKVLEWFLQWDLSQLNQNLIQLAKQARLRLTAYPNVHILGNLHSSTISFAFIDQHHADVASILAEQHIAVRVGEHCAKPYLHYLQRTGTIRMSLSHYNLPEDLDRFFAGLDNALAILGD